MLKCNNQHATDHNRPISFSWLALIGHGQLNTDKSDYSPSFFKYVKLKTRMILFYK